MFQQIASGVYFLEVGKGISRSNVYFVRSSSSWILIDAASANYGRLIRKTAESLFGANRPPKSILLTHDHPDHAGSARELALLWNCPVYVHTNELTLALNNDLATVERFANPLDKKMVLPLLRILPRRRVELILEKASLKDVVKALDPGAPVPGLPDWNCVPVPGHTPGQVAFFRASDGVLITGDALVTVDLNSLWGFLLWSLHLSKQKISSPPSYSTWNKQMARESVVVLAGLEPRVLATGHGAPMTGDDITHRLRIFANNFAGHLEY